MILAGALAGQAKDNYYSSVVLHLPMNGTNGSATFTDTKGHSVTAKNGAALTSSVVKFGKTSAKLIGSTDYLTIPASSDFLFGTSDFTIETWVYMTGTPDASQSAQLFGRHEYGSSSTFVFFITSDLKLGFWFAAAATNYYGTKTITLNSWNHVAVCRKGSQLIFAINGSIYTVTISASLSPDSGNATSAYTIGSDQDGDEAKFDGYLSDFRITKGVARYTDNYVTPKRLFPVY